MKKLVSNFTTCLFTILLTINSKAQLFQQSDFIIGTYGERQMELPNYEIKQYLDGGLVGPALQSFNNRKNAYIDHLVGIKNAHFNLMSGVLFPYGTVWNYRNDEILYSLELLSTNPNLQGLKRLVTNPEIFGWVKASTSPFMSIGSTAYTYSQVIMDSYYPNGPDYITYCPSANCDDVLYGFHIMDEPLLNDRENIHSWGNYLNFTLPGKVSLINYNSGAYWGDFSTNSGRRGYRNHMISFMSPISPTNTGYSPDIVPFVYYPFSTTYCEALPTDSFSISIGDSTLKNYFWALSETRKLAGNKPLWCYPLTTNHTNRVPVNHPWLTHINTCVDTVNVTYTNPTYNHIMFMDFCPLAYGAKGLVYFTYDKLLQNNLFYNAITDPIYGTCTQRYEEVKNINHYIKNIVGPIVMQSKWIGAFHKSSLPTNETELINNGELEDDLLTSSRNSIISDVSNDNILFGLFKKSHPDLNCNNYSILVVNKDLKSTPTSFTVTLKGNWINQISIAQPIGVPPTIDSTNPCGPYLSPGSPYNGSLSYKKITGTYWSVNNTTTFDMPILQGGEGRMISIDGCSVTIDPGDGNASAYILSDFHLNINPNPTSGNTEIEFLLSDTLYNSSVEIKLYDVFGQEVMQLKTFSKVDEKMRTNIESGYLDNGLYNVVLNVNGFNVASKKLQVAR